MQGGAGTEVGHIGRLQATLPMPGVGHYGIFNGSRFRTQIAPRVAKFIRAHDPRAGSPPRNVGVEAALHRKRRVIGGIGPWEASGSISLSRRASKLQGRISLVSRIETTSAR
jgi:PHB de-polymerase C-terminus